MNTHDVRIWDIRVYKGMTKTTYNLRWTAAGRQFSKAFATKALAESRQTELMAAQRRGEGFDTETGLPESEIRKQLAEITWYRHALDFADMKWPGLEPGSRRSLADSLATLTLALVDTQNGAPGYRIALRVQDCTLPKKGWGELCFAESSPYAYKAWTTTAATAPAKP